MKALPEPIRVFREEVSARGTWWEHCECSTVARFGGELRRITGVARDDGKARENCLDAVARYDGSATHATLAKHAPLCYDGRDGSTHRNRGR